MAALTHRNPPKPAETISTSLSHTSTASCKSTNGGRGANEHGTALSLARGATLFDEQLDEQLGPLATPPRLMFFVGLLSQQAPWPLGTPGGATETRCRRLHLSLLLLWKCAWMAFLHTRQIWTRGAFVRGIFIRGVFVPGIFLRGV